MIKKREVIKKPDLNSVRLTRVKGDIATVKLTLRLNTKEIPAPQFRKLWKHLAIAMVCTMTPAQQLEFKAEIDKQMRKLRGAK